MNRVTYVPKGLVVILKATGVTLALGRTKYRYPRWVVSNDVLKMLREQNPDVDFVKGSK